MIPSLSQTILTLGNAQETVTLSPEQARDLVHHHSTLVQQLKFEQAQANLASRMLFGAEQRDSLFAAFKSIAIIQKKNV